MTSQQSTRRQIDTAQGAVILDCFFGVAGAGGIEAAILSKQRTHGVAIQPDERFQDEAHCLLTVRQCFSRLRTIAALSASRAPERALTTISTGGNSC